MRGAAGIPDKLRIPCGLGARVLLAAGENFPFVADEKVTARRPRTGRGG